MSYHNCYCQLQVDVRNSQMTAFESWRSGHDPFETIYTDSPRIRRRLERILDLDIEVYTGPEEAPSNETMKDYAVDFLDTYNDVTGRSWVFEQEPDEPSCVRWEYHDGDLVAIYNYSVHESGLSPADLEARGYRVHLSFVWFENEWQFARQRPRDGYRGRHLQDLAGE